MKRGILVAIPLVVFLLIAVFLASGLGKDPSVIPSPLIGKPAPAFDLPLLHEPQRRMSNQDLAGSPYLLNVWASWCYACQIEHSLVTAVAEERWAPLIGLNYKDQPADARRWLQQFGDPYTAHLTDLDGRVGIDFGVYGAPETFLIDGDGMIVFKHIGPLTEEVVDEQLRPLLRSLKEAGS